MGRRNGLNFAENDMREKLNGHFVSYVRDNLQPLVMGGLRALYKGLSARATAM